MYSFRHAQTLWLMFAFTQGMCIGSSILHMHQMATAAALIACVLAGTLLYKLEARRK